MKLWKVMSLTVLFTATAVGQPITAIEADQVTGEGTIDSTVPLQLDESVSTTKPGAKDYPLLDPSLLEAFLDGTIGTSMEDNHLPGLTISVVQNGRLILAKGYGLARTDPPQPVVADQTLFRIASISKTITFSAVMQLVEKGLLDLNADIENIVDDVRIEDRFGPITMVDLMTHSAGFEDAYLGFFFADSLETDHSLTDYLNQYAPHRVRPPGEQIVYSNFGVSMAGKVVESVSGEDFADYTDAHIFQPLGMTRSSFREYPNQSVDGYLDPELEKDRAIGYRWAGGSFTAYDQFFQHRGMYPAGSVSSTATDMAVFMLAHLNGGAIDGKRILAADTVDQMHTRLRSNADGIQGNAHGFWSGQIQGYKTIEHDGYIFGFFSTMVLVPELGLGVFASTNGDSGRNSVTSIPRRLIEKFYPPYATPLQPDVAFSEQGGVYAGRYMGNRRGHEIVDKLAVLGGEVTVSVNNEGYLITSSSRGSQRWLPLGDQVFENVDDGSRIAFEVDQSDTATHLYSSYGSNVFERVSLPHSSQFFYIASGSTIVLAIGSLFGFWLRRRQLVTQTAGERLAAIGIGITSLTWLLVFVTFYILMSGAYAVSPEILVRYPAPLGWVVHLSATAAAIMVVVCTFGLMPVWRDRSWPVWRRIRHSIIVLAGLVLVWVLNDWNALGFRYLGA